MTLQVVWSEKSFPTSCTSHHFHTLPLLLVHPCAKCNDIYIYIYISPLRTWAQHYATPCPKLCTHTKAQPQHEQQKCRTLQYMHIMYTVYGVQYSMMYTGGIQGGLQHSHTTNGKCALAGPASHLYKQQLAI